MFKDGIVIEGFWKKDGDSFTQFYNQQGEKLTFNPGQTWIHIVPSSIEVLYQDTSAIIEAEEDTEDYIGEENLEENMGEEDLEEGIPEQEGDPGQADGPEVDRPAGQEDEPAVPVTTYTEESIDSSLPGNEDIVNGNNDYEEDIILDLLNSVFPYIEDVGKGA